MNAHYLLTTELARRLYEEAARDLPLVDYHNHLSAADLSSNRPFEDLAELWLLSDPYKHRVMRICGVDETLITGSASHYEKFKAWCEVYPRLMGGPLYDWSRTEMAEVFGITHPICADNARRIWQEANEKLRQPEFRARGIFKHFKVEYAAPCAAITEDLRPFLCLESLAPSLRADDLLKPDKTLLDTLGSLTGLAIVDQESLTRVLRIRLDEFHTASCRFSDHALDEGFRYVPEDGKTDKRIRALAGGETLPAEDQEALCSAMLRLLGAEYAKRGWTMQLHIGAQRFTSSRLRTLAGPAGGFAGIGGGVDVRSLVALLDDLERGSAGLPKTILYTLNPADNALMAVLCGSFIGVTQGPAWWWCDHLQGMREMLEVFSSFSVLSTFIGALFLAGFPAGIFLGIVLGIYSYFYARRRGYATGHQFNMKKMGKAFLSAFGGLMTIVIIFCGVSFGIMTATESAAVAALWSFLCAFVFYRTVPLKAYYKIASSAIKTLSTIMILLAIANAFGWVVAYLRIPNKIAAAILALTDNKFVILLLINLVILFLGCIMSISSILLIITPIVVPILQKLDYSLVQFGIVMILNLGIGLLTPPVGAALYVGSAVSGLGVGKTAKALMPFYLMMVVTLLALAFIPGLTRIFGAW